MSNREYKLAEIKARHSRDEILEMLLDYKAQSWEGATHHELIEAIVNLHEDGCEPYSKFSDDELARCLLDEREYLGVME